MIWNRRKRKKAAQQALDNWWSQAGQKQPLPQRIAPIERTELERQDAYRRHMPPRDRIERQRDRADSEEFERLVKPIDDGVGDFKAMAEERHETLKADEERDG